MILSNVKFDYMVKNCCALTLCALFIIFSTHNAMAIDFKAKGEWVMRFDFGSGSQGASATRDGGSVYGYGHNVSPIAGPDSFNANQRIRLQFDAIISESLSGTVFFEIGDSKWGHTATGAALGADSHVFRLRQAYLDWIIPNTKVNVRMGIQGIALPAYTTNGSMILNNDVAGIVVSNKFNDNIGLTSFWARPYNDNYINDSNTKLDSSNYLDNVDMFGLAMPMSFDGIKIVPWLAYMAVGSNFTRDNNNMGNAIGTVKNGLFPRDFLGIQALTNSSFNHDLYPYGNVWYAGNTGEVTMLKPMRIAWDLNYGFADFGTISNTYFGDYQLKRHGFYGSLLFEYKMNWGTPGIYGWYSTGDDDDPANGSERMPSISNINAHPDFSHYASSGAISGRESVLGRDLIGTWGLGIRIKDLSFVEDIKHTFRINYFAGTNSTAMAEHVMIQGISDDGSIQNSSTGYYKGPLDGFYLTTSDYAIEFALTTDYQIYENLRLNVEMAYLALHLDQGVWGNDFTATDAWNVTASFIYSF